MQNTKNSNGSNFIMANLNELLSDDDYHTCNDSLFKDYLDRVVKSYVCSNVSSNHFIKNELNADLRRKMFI